jgi:integrase/recombinase XerD
VLIAYKDSLLAEGLQHTTIDRHLATLRSFFQWLVDDGVIERSPAEGVRFLNPKKISSTRGFSDEEVRRMLELPNLHTRTGAQHYAILMLLFYCGLRRSELCALRTSSIMQERGHSVLKLRGKGNAERVIPLVPAVVRAIAHHLRISGRELGRDGWLFRPLKNSRGGGELDKPIDASLVFYLVTKYAREAGVANRVSPHSCRATAISNARDHDVPDRAIQEFAGWSSTQMITRYDKRKTAIEDSAAHAIRYGEEKADSET